MPRQPCRIQMDNQDVVSGKPVVQKRSGAVSGAEHPGRPPLTRRELDAVYATSLYAALSSLPTKRWAACLPLKRWSFPSSTTAAASAAAISAPSSFHQGRTGHLAAARTASVRRGRGHVRMRRVSRATFTTWAAPLPTSAAHPAKEQMKNGMCAGGKHCLAPAPCGKIIVDHRRISGHPAQAARHCRV